MDDIDDIVQEFLVESYENLDQLDQDLVALESAPSSRELLSSVFRTIHTIKGTSGFLAFSDLERVAHVGESLLVQLRDGQRQMDQHTTDVLLRMVDTIREILGRIESTGAEGGVEVDDVVAAIQRTLDGETAPAAPAAPSEAVEPAATATAAEPEPEPEPAPAPAPELAPEPAAHAAPTGGIRTATAPQPASASSITPPVGTPVSSSSTKDVPPTKDVSSSKEAPTGRSSGESSIRVDIGLLDELMRQVGELVLVRNQISQLAGFDSDADLTRFVPAALPHRFRAAGGGHEDPHAADRPHLVEDAADRA